MGKQAHEPPLSQSHLHFPVGVGIMSSMHQKVIGAGAVCVRS